MVSKLREEEKYTGKIYYKILGKTYFRFAPPRILISVKYIAGRI